MCPENPKNINNGQYLLVFIIKTNAQRNPIVTNQKQILLSEIGEKNV